jgi:hypothetical protein
VHRSNQVLAVVWSLFCPNFMEVKAVHCLRISSFCK